MRSIGQWDSSADIQSPIRKKSKGREIIMDRAHLLKASEAVIAHRFSLISLEYL